MRVITLYTLIIFLIAALAMGCGITTSCSATNLTQPVMLGKIRKLHGKGNEQWQYRGSFDFSIRSIRHEFSFGTVYAGSKANYELLKLTETSDDKIVIDEVYIGSFSTLGYGYEEESWVDIEGGIYREQGGGDETQ